VKPHMATLIAEEDLLLFQRIERVIQELPDIDLGGGVQGEKRLVSCHMIVRALASVFPEVVPHDGYFARRGQRHSWLTVRREPGLIIDPYPIGLLGGPIMVYGSYVTTPWSCLYMKARLSNLGGVEFRRHVTLVTKALRSTFDRLQP